MSTAVRQHVVFKQRKHTLERLENFIASEGIFLSCGLYSRLYRERLPVSRLQHYAAPGRISFQEATGPEVMLEYTDAKLGECFGPTWSTHWFCVDIDIPDRWLNSEVHLVWDSHSEAMVWIDGNPKQGLSSEYGRFSYILTNKWQNDKSTAQHLFVEMACNGLLGAGKDALVGPPDPDKMFPLLKAEIACFDREVYELLKDFQVIIGIAKSLPDSSERGYQAMYTANTMMNTCDLDDRSTFNKVHEIAQTFLRQRNGDAQHIVHAVGNCHIDTAWLWSYDETKRKCARSWASAVDLLERYPQFTFVASQAQQFAWLKEFYPNLYIQIKQLARHGRFIPVGATWVEMDGNIPSGESFIRQFLYGQRFFQQEFGIQCTEFWLPDTFGYSAQLPQIMSMFNIHRFVTQKLSWNQFNKFPHHTFWWEGLDGSRVLTHFPPGENYGMTGTAEELLKTKNNFSDKGRSGQSLYLYGYGDGGNGPTDDMIERLTRLADVDGIPKVKFSTPDQFFCDIEQARDQVYSLEQGLCCWSGELFLEMHNGTYTTHHKIKQSNRMCERLLTITEMICVMALSHSRHHQDIAEREQYVYPKVELERLWKLLLLNQFHDVLPGSSIQQVYKDADRHYAEIREACAKLCEYAVRCVRCQQNDSGAKALISDMGWKQKIVVFCKRSMFPDSVHIQECAADTASAWAVIDLFPCSFSLLHPIKCESPVTVAVDKNTGFISLANGLLKAVVDTAGRVVELYTADSPRNLVCDGGACNQLCMYDDLPLFWDAWDVMHYHLETRQLVTAPFMVKVQEAGPIHAEIKVCWKISEQSSIYQIIALDAECPYLIFKTKVSWKESHKILKMECATNIHSLYATYETQCGHVTRPTHRNTSWDVAQYEVCGHKWADLSDYSMGLAVLNDSHYGMSTAGSVMSLSLLRSPKNPDPNADMGEHVFAYALMPHTGSFQSAGVIQHAYSLNCHFTHDRMHTIPSDSDFLIPLISSDTSQVIVQAVKQAEDGDEIVVRVYEAFGGWTRANITTSMSIKSAKRCDGYEKVIDASKELLQQDGTISLELQPFQIVSVLLVWQ